MIIGKADKQQAKDIVAELEAVRRELDNKTEQLRITRDELHRAYQLREALEVALCDLQVLAGLHAQKIKQIADRVQQDPQGYLNAKNDHS